MMGLPADYVTAVTMPCFGTTDRTKSNAIIVSEQLGATVRVIDIGESVMQHFKDIGHDPENRNVVYENSQARERTQILMDVANGFADGGIHVGTEDMSEFASAFTAASISAHFSLISFATRLALYPLSSRT